MKFKIKTESFPFFYIKQKLKPKLKKHSSLYGSLVSMCQKCDDCETNIKRDINVQKIKVKKTHLN